MDNLLEEFLSSHPRLTPIHLSVSGSRRYEILLPLLPEGRSFKAALELPNAFPEAASAIIRFSSESILQIPHVESDGKLCIGDGDPGPLSDASATERITQVIDGFFNKFVEPWCTGSLDGDFVDEALSYWIIHCNRNSSTQNAVFKIYTTNKRVTEARVYEGLYLTGRRIIFTSERSDPLSLRYIGAMAPSEQYRSVVVADIPISHALTPKTWPNSLNEIEHLLRSRLGSKSAENFLGKTGRRNSSTHKIVLFRAPDCSFGFLLSGGPNTIVHQKKSTRAYPSTRVLPLIVERLDPAWTCGREQHAEVPLRQQKHIVVIGAGALGSPVIEQLAKAGVGKITIVDDELLSAANINRHVLGADAISTEKATSLAKQLSIRYPSCNFKGIKQTASVWFQKNTLNNIDLILDLTGEPEVRLLIEKARAQHHCALIIGWFEPYVAAAHACLLPAGKKWMITSMDNLKSLQAVDWPSDVIQREPSCSSTFQSYTPAAATYGVALVAEAALDLLDHKIKNSIVRHWIRGQRFLDKQRPGLELKEWALSAKTLDGIVMEFPYE